MGPLKKNPSPQPRKRLHQQIAEKKGIAFVYFALRIAVIAVMVAQFFNRAYENVFLCLLTLVLFQLPGLIERHLSIDVPDTLEVIILLFIFAAEILGEIRAYYIAFPYWDTMLHGFNGFLAAAIGFSLVDILNQQKQVSLKLSPFFMAVTAFCFSMTIGVLWEFFEAFMDHFFLLDMQKDSIISAISSAALNPVGGIKPAVLHEITDVIVVSQGAEIPLGLGGYLDIGLHDTMQDLVINFVGAVFFSTIGYFYVKGRGKGRFVARFILRKMPKKPSK